MGFLERFLSRFKSGNSDLEMVMREMAAHPDMKVRRVLYLELLKGTLLLPLPKELEPSSNGKPLKELQLVTHPGEKGEILWHAFTSRQALHQWRPQFPEAYAAINGQQVFALAVQNKVDQVIINPVGPVGGRITSMELEMLAEGSIPMQGSEKVTTILSRTNTDYRFETPVLDGNIKLVSYLKDHLKTGDGILEGFLVRLAIGAGAPHLLLAIGYQLVPPEGMVKPVLEGIGREVGKYLEKGDYLDMIPFDEGNEWAKAIREKGIKIHP